MKRVTMELSPTELRQIKRKQYQKDIINLHLSQYPQWKHPRTSDLMISSYTNTVSRNDNKAGICIKNTLTKQERNQMSLQRKFYYGQKFIIEKDGRKIRIKCKGGKQKTSIKITSSKLYPQNKSSNHSRQITPLDNIKRKENIRKENQMKRFQLKILKA